jgi:hypothetical protein
MADERKTIKVVDRRLFTSEGEVREEYREEMQKAEAEAQPAAASPVTPVAPPPEPVIETSQAFLRLLDMLAQTASIYLEGIPDPATGRRAVDLTAARQIIDSISALREKTRGRLSFEETDAVEGLLGELQLVFSRLATSAKPRGPIPPPIPRRG